MSTGLSKIAPSNRMTGGQKSICRGVVAGAAPAAWCESVKTVRGMCHRPNSPGRLRRFVRVEHEQVRRHASARAVADAERQRLAGREDLIERHGALIGWQGVGLPVAELYRLRRDDVERQQVNVGRVLVRADTVDRELP